MPKLRGPELVALRLRYPGMKVIYMSWLHGKRAGAGRNAGDEHGAAAEPFTVKKSWK